jgi:hypothetical protein
MASTTISGPITSVINSLNSKNEFNKLIAGLKALKKKSDNDLSNLLVNERSFC